MSTLFVVFARENSACADQILTELKVAKYEVRTGEDTFDIHDASFAPAIEQGIESSSAMIVIWSKSASLSGWVKHALQSAQQLSKPIFGVVIDDTPLANLEVVNSVTVRENCFGSITQLLPSLPSVTAMDDVARVADMLSDPLIARRREAIGLAKQFLSDGEHREPLLALLERALKRELMMTVREQINEVLAEYEKSTLGIGQYTQHEINVMCSKGHVSRFDRRVICLPSGTIIRTVMRPGGRKLDEVYLKCLVCGEEMVVEIDCGGLK